MRIYFLLLLIMHIFEFGKDSSMFFMQLLRQVPQLILPLNKMSGKVYYLRHRTAIVQPLNTSLFFQFIEKSIVLFEQLFSFSHLKLTIKCDIMDIINERRRTYGKRCCIRKAGYHFQENLHR